MIVMQHKPQAAVVYSRLVVRSYTRLMSRLVFSSRENPEEGSDANEGADLPVQVTASKQRAKASFLHALMEAASRRCGPD